MGASCVALTQMNAGSGDFLGNRHAFGGPHLQAGSTGADNNIRAGSTEALDGLLQERHASAQVYSFGVAFTKEV